jgi:hypothetical protein
MRINHLILFQKNLVIIFPANKKIEHLSRQLDKINTSSRKVAWRPFQNARPLPRKPPESPVMSLAHFGSHYLRCTMADGTHSSNVICSKNRVAPLRPTTIPRLALCCYATFDRGLAQAEKVGVRGVGLIKFICVPGEHSAFIKKKKQKTKKMILNKVN